MWQLLEIDILVTHHPSTNDHLFAGNIFRYIFMNENFCILMRISLKFVPKGPIDNKWALVQVMAWRRTGDNLLPEPMLTRFSDTYMWYKEEMSYLVLVRAELMFPESWQLKNQMSTTNSVLSRGFICFKVLKKFKPENPLCSILKKYVCSAGQ